jgi:hypothetical protein
MEGEETRRKFEILRDAVRDKLNSVTAKRAGLEDFGNLLIPTALTILLFAASYLVELSYYWIPASFLIVLISGVVWYLTYVNAPSIIHEPKYLRSNLLTAIKTLAAIMYALGAIFVVTLIPLILIAIKFITPDTNFNFVIPLVAVVFTIGTSYWVPDRGIKMIEDNPFFDEILYKIYKLSGAHKTKDTKLLADKELQKFESMNMAFGVLFFIFMIGYFCLYAVAFLESLKLINNLYAVLGFTIIEFVLLLLTQKFFATRIAKQELENAENNLSKVSEEINQCLMRGTCTEEEYARLLKLFLTAQKYDVSPQNTLKIIGSYKFSTNKDYFDNTFKYSESLTESGPGPDSHTAV